MNYFFIDAETDGLYGRFLSTAIIVTDEKGVEKERFYGKVELDEKDIKSDWVKENVLPYLKNADSTYKNEYELLEAVWAMWMKYRTKAYAVGDVIHPVESRLFAECVSHNKEEREFLAPFPFLDLATLLVSKGIDPLADRSVLSGLEILPHDAMNDVRMAVKIWFRYTE